MKKLIAAAALAALVAGGAFAQLSFGVTGVQYYQEDENGNLPSFDQVVQDLQDGTGVYYGGFVELTLHKLGFGFAFNYSTIEGYNSDYMLDSAYDQISYDGNFYLAYHLFGGRAFIDPILQLGIGMTAFDWKNKDAYIADSNWADQDDPMMASMYWDAGVGLGINLGPVGVFTKLMWNSLIDGVVTGTNDYTGEEYEIPAFDPMPFKVIVGAKIIL